MRHGIATAWRLPSPGRRGRSSRLAGRWGLVMRSTQTLGTILYVEDNEALRRAFASLLRSRGLDGREADSGARALNQLGVRPDVPILHGHSPYVDGSERS